MSTEFSSSSSVESSSVFAVLLEPRTKIQELKDMYCDCYKDVHGVKARWIYGMDLSEQELTEMLDSLEEEWKIVRRQEQEILDQNEAEAVYQIQKLIECGAKDIRMAVKWLHEAHDTGGDDRYLEFELGVRYDFLKILIK